MRHSRGLEVLRNVRHALAGNLVSFSVSLFVTIVLPKFIGVEQFGFWQLYLLYAGFAHIVLLGWNEGILLRYGGMQLDGLVERRLRAQILAQTAYLGLLGSAGLFVATFVFTDLQIEYRHMIHFLCLTVLISNLRLMLLKSMHATALMRQAARAEALDRILFGVLIVVFLAFGTTRFEWIVIASLLGHGLSFIIMLFNLRTVVRGEILAPSISAGSEIVANIAGGSRLMLAEITVLATSGLARVMVERGWGIRAFANAALALSLVNVVLMFVNSIGLAVFPYLRRITQGELIAVYRVTSEWIGFATLFLLGLLIPIDIAAALWLPEFTTVTPIMSTLFPVVVYEGRIALHLSGTVKTLRLERDLLFVSIAALMIAAGVAAMGTLIIHDIGLVVLGIPLASALRFYALDEMVSRRLGCGATWRRNILDGLCVGSFLVGGAFFDLSIIPFVAVLFGVILTYGLLRRVNLSDSLRAFRST